ncbi:MAG: hypothetical protein JST06_10560 [Bacteroidetes bacterium]|nr:hypothetical protein [Bacteroidota bacterium]
MKNCFRLLVLVLVCMFMVPSRAQTQDPLKPFEEVIQVVALFQRADTCKGASRDGCLMEALEKALAILWQPERHQARMNVYWELLKHGGIQQSETYRRVANDMMAEAERCQENPCLARSHMLLADDYFRAGDLEEAQRESSLALIHAERAGQVDLEIESELNHASILVRSKDRNARVDALNILLQAKLQALEHEDSRALNQCYEELSNFYADIGAFDSSAAYKSRQLQMLIQRGEEDSNRIQELRIELAEPLLKGSNSARGAHILDEVIRYGLKHQKAYLINQAMQYYRNYFLEQKNLIAIARLYNHDYPRALGLLNEPVVRDRVKAYLFDANDQKDSALFYYQRALEGLLKEGSNFQYAYLQLFHGSALRRWGHYPEAIATLKNGKEYAMDYQPFLIRFMAELDTTYRALNQYDSAYFYHLRFSALNKSWDSSVDGEALLRQQIAAQQLEHELAERKAEHLREQRHFIQYLSITLGIVILFLVFCLMSSLSVPKWAITTTGFFAFVVLFEFIIMVTDEYAAEKVQGEPMYLLLCKIVIILLLSPLHHKLEEKLLHYFHEHRLINTSSIWDWTVFKDFKKLFGKENKVPALPERRRSHKPKAVTSSPRKTRKKTDNTP